MPATAFLLAVLASSSLLLGAALGLAFRWPQRLVAGITAFGSGALIATLAFDLVAEGQERSGIVPVAVGFLLGAALFVLANEAISSRGGFLRKPAILRRFAHLLEHDRSREGVGTGRGGGVQEQAKGGAVLAVFLGALLDGIPESVVIGISLLLHAAFSPVFVIAVFLANFPEGLSSSVHMREHGYTVRRVLLLWGGLVLSSGMAALLGNVLLGGAPMWFVAGAEALAAGAILAMLADTMMPEAFEQGGPSIAMWTALGFLAPLVMRSLLHSG